MYYNDQNRHDINKATITFTTADTSNTTVCSRLHAMYTEDKKINKYGRIIYKPRDAHTRFTMSSPSSASSNALTFKATCVLAQMEAWLTAWTRNFPAKPAGAVGGHSQAFSAKPKADMPAMRELLAELAGLMGRVNEPL